MATYRCELTPEIRAKLKKVVIPEKLESWSATVEAENKDAAKSEAVRALVPLIREGSSSSGGTQANWFSCSEINE